jgi:hypothetical protein
MGRPRSCECGVCEKCKHAAYMRVWYQQNRERVLGQIHERRKTGEMATAERERYHRDPFFKKRKLARCSVKNNLKRGRIERQPCEICGTPNAHAHHEDYDRPLDVRWLCEMHHRQIHGEKVAA